MKRLLINIMTISLLLTACDTSYEEKVELYQLKVVLADKAHPEKSFQGATLELRGIGRDAIFTDTADAKGEVTFSVPSGIYEATSQHITRIKNGINNVEISNGTSGQIVVGREKATSIVLNMVSAKVSQLVIKELYNGGITKDNGQAFQSDKCFILYNNSNTVATYDNLCVGIISPYNSHAGNKWYDNDGKLIYESEGYLPALDGIWFFPQDLTLQPYSQVVVNCHGAIDNTQTYPQSVNYANSDYYCMYDPETGYVNSMYYPTPSSVIPASHYLKAAKIGISNAWALSVMSPALVIFQVKGTTPREFATNVSNLTYTPKAKQDDINKVLKIPVEWVLDGIEVFMTTAKNANQKRLTSQVDAGSVGLTNQHGHTLYRNVDKEATEQLPENAGKLVYNYQLGVEPTTDPSGIDAEASAKNGAHIIYMDTNNSTTDFHERLKCSLRE